MICFKVLILLFIIENGFAAKLYNSEVIKTTENLYSDISELSIDILYNLDPGHCYSIITDNLYQNFLDINFFEIVKQKTYFIVKISSYEDLLSPNYQTVKSLLEIRNAGCQVYLIYLSSGYQMGRLLKFGEKYRVIDTRVKFIILYDHRLFIKELHYIWNRIINIIFIKQYGTRRKKTGAWFELTTVPFPLRLDNIFVSRRLDFWKAGKFRYGNTLFRDKITNLEGKLLHIAVLEHTPAIFKDKSNVTKYYGLENEIIRSLSYVMNFSYTLYESIDTISEKWGRIQSNGFVTGLLGETVENYADIALGDLHYTQYHLKILDLSVPYLTECLTFLTPETYSDNSWKTLILPFSGGMWAGVLLSLFCVGFVFYFLAKFHKKYTYRKNTISRKVMALDLVRRKIKSSQNKLQLDKDIFDELSNCIIYTYSMLLVVSLPRLPQNWSMRLLTGWYWVYCLLVVVAYRSSMTAILANPIPKLTIDTLQQLADSSIECGAWGEQNKEFFITSLDEAGQKIGEKLIQTDNINEVIDNIVKGFYAYYENEYFLKEIRQSKKLENYKQSLHIMKECVIHMPVAIGLQKNSAIKPKIDKYLRRIIESGLVNKWLSDITQNFMSDTETEPQQALMDLKKFYGAFVALAIGYFLSLLVLSFEIIYWKYVVQRNKSYDKLQISSNFK